MSPQNLCGLEPTPARRPRMSAAMPHSPGSRYVRTCSCRASGKGPRPRYGRLCRLGRERLDTPHLLSPPDRELVAQTTYFGPAFAPPSLCLSPPPPPPSPP